jgi:hypothetical protein
MEKKGEGEKKEEEVEGGEEKFIEKKELDVKIKMEMNDYVKLKEIIEKNELLIRKKGEKMEILMKINNQKNKNFNLI